MQIIHELLKPNVNLYLFMANTMSSGASIGFTIQDLAKGDYRQAFGWGCVASITIINAVYNLASSAKLNNKSRKEGDLEKALNEKK